MTSRIGLVEQGISMCNKLIDELLFLNVIKTSLEVGKVRVQRIENLGTVNLIFGSQKIAGIFCKRGDAVGIQSLNYFFYLQIEGEKQYITSFEDLKLKRYS